VSQAEPEKIADFLQYLAITKSIWLRVYGEIPIRQKGELGAMFWTVEPALSTMARRGQIAHHS